MRLDNVHVYMHVYRKGQTSFFRSCRLCRQPGIRTWHESLGGFISAGLQLTVGVKKAITRYQGPEELWPAEAAGFEKVAWKDAPATYGSVSMSGSSERKIWS